MLINCDTQKKLYVIGMGVISKGLQSLIAQESNVEVVQCRYENLNEIPDNSQCMLGLTEISIRRDIIEQAREKNITWPSYVHPSAVVNSLSSIGPGCYVEALSHVMHNTKCLEFCMIGAMSLVAHNSILSSNVFLGPKSIVCGSTVVGNNVSIGTMVTIKDKISIADGCTFAMNTIVRKSVTSAGRYYSNGLTLRKF